MKILNAKKLLLLLLLLSLIVTLAKADLKDSEIPKPSQPQLAWQQAELGVVFHYDLHAFDDKHYNQNHNRKTPCADVNMFNPAQLDTDQWVRTAKDMGARFAILTASHETGFRLWQSDVNPYCLKAVKWGNGKRDIVREFINSCKKYDIKPGIYMGTRWNSHLGIWDFKVTEQSTIIQRQYNDLIEKEVEEICSRYGDLFEIWFDGGAYGPEKGGPDVLSVFEKYQKNCLFYHNYDRADARWGGSESGTVPYPCWATFPYKATGSGESAINRHVRDKGFNLLKHGNPDGKFWMPAMSDAPLRNHEWFWDQGDDRKIYPLNSLVNMYYNSVGRNSTLILGLTPDDRGLIPDADVNRCKQFGRTIRDIFSNQLAKTSGRGNTLELTLPANAVFDHIVLQEDIRQGERVRSFKLEYFSNGKWTEFNTGTCIGHKRIIKIKPVAADKIRLTVSESIAKPIIKTFAVYDSLNPKNDDKKLKVLSFNILQAGANAANVGFRNQDFGGSRIDEIAEVILNSGADIVGLQETHYADNIDKPLLAALGDGWTLHGTVLSKHKLDPIETGDFFTLCRAHLDSDKSVVVINTHWWPKGGGLDKIQKMLNAGQIPEDLRQFEREILDSLSSDKGPRGYLRTVNIASKYIDAGETVIITGDFNEPSHLDWTQYYAQKGADRLVKNSTDTPLNFKIEWQGSKLLTQADLKDAYRMVHNNEVAKPGITWTPPYPNSTPGRRDYDDQILTRIDFIYFAGDQLTAVDAAVIGESGKFTDIVYPRKWPSDHRAVLAEFDMAPKSKTLADRLEYIGIAVEDPNWHIWGCSPITGPQGKTHLMVTRWPVSAKFDPGWRIASQIAHYVSDSPKGPFTFSEISLTGTGKDTWDKTGIHNSAIHKVGDQYALLYISNTGLKNHPSNQCIGMATSRSLYGPWKKVGTDGLILSPSEDPAHWTHKASNGVNNPAFLQHPDGRFFLYYKSNKSKMGLAIADKLQGPYIHQPNPVTSNKVGIEDGYAFIMNGKICLLTTDNHGIIKRGGGLLWTSDDGKQFDPIPLPGFGRMSDYIPTEKFTHAKTYYGRGGKFERPQVLIVEDKPAYLYAPAGTNIQGGTGTASYVLKFIFDLTD